MAAQHIDQGEFVAQYAGELLRNVEADKRLAQYDTNNTDVGHALLVGCQRIFGFTRHEPRRISIYVKVVVLVSYPGGSGGTAFRHSLPAFQH